MKTFAIIRHILFIAIAAAVFVISAPLAGRADTPLLMPGKQTLYQRVLTRPGAVVRQDAAASAAAVVTPTPFEPFYVYAERNADGKDWIRVGRSLTAAEGWLLKDKSIPWAQTIVAAFSNPAGRQRSLIFKSRDAMDEVFNSEDVFNRMRQLRQEAESNQVPPDSPVVSIEPANYIDIDTNFYILPILAFQQARVQNTQRVKYLQIASLPLSSQRHAPGGDQANTLANYNVGVVFVIDTTQSMQPYIDQVQDAVDAIRRKIANGPEGQRVRFGLVGFRNNIKLRPNLQYVTKTFLKLDENSTATDFINAIKTMKAARTSSSSFDEDSIAGVMTAIDDMNWDPFKGRYIVLVTDAGPRPPGPDSQNGSLAVEQVNQMVKERNRNILIETLHLKTEQGGFDHDYAEQQYRKLSDFGAGKQLYFGIDAGDQQKFRQSVDQIGTSLAQDISQTIQGHLTQAPREDDNSMAAALARAGRAMQLAYLGHAEGTQVPDFFEGWLCDRDPLDRHARPVDIRVLMTKNQLSTLRDVVRQTINIGNSTAGGNSQDFFRQLQEAVARMARDPQHLVRAGFTTLGGALGEYLEGLPYQSEITGLTQEDWESLSPSRERELIDSLESKIVALDKIHNESRRWVAPYPGAPDGEYVTTVPLSVMP
jgi:serine/threonine-protein kinase PpkA